jgi:hypothetical protein
MMRFSVMAFISGAILLGGSQASAQERGQVGLTMGYPAAVGIAWHATDRLGIKVETNFLTASSELESGPLRSDREVESNSFGFAVAGLFYLGRSDNVSTYFSPRYAYSRTTSELEGSDAFVIPVELLSGLGLSGLPSLPILPRDIRTETTGHAVSGSFGVQYSPVRRFSIFGEVGLDHTSQESETSSFLSSETEASSFGIHSAVGVILYFK